MIPTQYSHHFAKALRILVMQKVKQFFHPTSEDIPVDWLLYSNAVILHLA